MREKVKEKSAYFWLQNGKSMVYSYTMKDYEHNTKGRDCPDLTEDFGKPEKVRLSPVTLLLPLALLAVFGGLIWLFLAQRGQSGQLVINEVVTSNQNCYAHETLGSPDFVELYNGTNHTIRLKGYGLSDSIKNCYKYTFPDVEMAPGTYLLVYFAGGVAGAEEDPFCTGFGLSKDGDTVVLVDSNYNLLDSVEVPALQADVSYARGADGQWGYCLTPTPGQENTGEILEKLEIAP